MTEIWQRSTEGMMDDLDYDRKLDELDRLLNDPDSRMEPALVWALLAEISQRDATPILTRP